MSKPKSFDTWTPAEQEAWRRKARERVRKWRAANPDKAREQARKWRAANPDKSREQARKWCAANPDKAREIYRKWRAANPDKARERVRKWLDANPDKAREMYRANGRKQTQKLSLSYVAAQLNISARVLREYPDLLAAKREQLQILRQLKAQQTNTNTTKKEPNKCTRTPRTSKKFAKTSQKQHTRRGLTKVSSRARL